MPQSHHPDLPEHSGTGHLHILFYKAAARLVCGSTMPQALTLTSLPIPSASQCLFPPVLTISPHLEKCSQMQHHSPLKLTACPPLRSRVPARVCQATFRHDLRPVCNMLQRCLFSSGENPQSNSDTGIHKPV